MNFVTFDDRDISKLPIQLLALSLDKHAPHSRLILYSHNEFPGLEAWCRDKLRNLKVDFVRVSISSLSGWSLKPQILMAALDKCEAPVCWLDTDLLAVNSLQPFIEGLDLNALTVATQRGVPDPNRSTVWGNNFVDRVGSSINTSVLAVSPKHRPLLELWNACMLQDPYMAEQSKPHSQRQPHMYGDQDVLEGLICSDHDLVEDIGKINVIKGSELIQHEADFGLKSRLFRSPRDFLFVHAQGIKPWNLKSTDPVNLKHQCALLSAYMYYANKYAQDSGVFPDSGSWLRRRTFLIDLSKVLMFNHPFKRSIPVHLLQLAAGKLRKATP